jgi:hypothetical protein
MQASSSGSGVNGVSLANKEIGKGPEGTYLIPRKGGTLTLEPTRDP